MLIEKLKMKLLIGLVLTLVLIVDLGRWFKRELKEMFGPDYSFYDKNNWSGWG